MILYKLHYNFILKTTNTKFIMNRHKASLQFLLRSRSYSTPITVNTIDYCANIVRQHDHENFLSTLLMNKEIRSGALVVRAFNVEIARIQDQTTDPKTAEFRLQFWSDTLQKIYKKDQILKNIPANPIAQELYKICSLYKLPKRYLDQLITSRHLFMKNKHFNTIDDVEKYAHDTVSSIYFLILGIAGISNVHADHAASHLGKAQGITNILRSIHVSSHHKIVSIPMDILMKHQVSQENVLRRLDSENFRNVVFDMASRANSHLQKARRISVPNQSKQIFLPAVAIDSYLKKLQQCHFNVHDKSLQRGNSLLPLKLFYYKFINKF